MNMLLAPNKDGMVSVYRDGEFLETYPITYVDVKNNTVQQPEPPPVETQTPAPTVAPTEPVQPTETPAPEPTAEPAIIPPDTGEGEVTGETDQTGYVPGNGQNNNELASALSKGKANGKGSDNKPGKDKGHK